MNPATRNIQRASIVKTTLPTPKKIEHIVSHIALLCKQMIVTSSNKKKYFHMAYCINTSAKTCTKFNFFG